MKDEKQVKVGRRDFLRKVGVGTAYASSSRTWFTVWNGILTEAYYPTVDRPQASHLRSAPESAAG